MSEDGRDGRDAPAARAPGTPARAARRRKAPPHTEWRGDTLHGRVRIKGKLHRWTLRTDDVDLARERVALDIGRLKAQADGSVRVTYDDAIASWGANHLAGIRPKTAKRYWSSLNQIEPVLRPGGRPLFLDEIDTDKIGELVRIRRSQKASTATIRRDLTPLSGMFEFAGVNPNPALFWIKRLKERRDPIVLPEAAHIERVIKRSPPGLGALARAAWLTGCRLEELATAHRSRLDHTRRQLSVIGKGNKLRTLGLSPEAYEHLRAQPVQLHSKWLFWHDAGEPYKNVSSRFSAIVRAEFLATYDAAHGTNARSRPPLAELLDAQDIPEWVDIGFRTFRFHDLRHRYAVDRLKEGQSIYDLKEHLGHESVKTTEIYLKFLTAEEKRSVMYGRSARAAADQRGAS